MQLSWIQRLHNRFFPPYLTPRTQDQVLLEKLFPAIDWRKVHFHKGLPWFVNQKHVMGIVIPDVWDRQTVHVHFNIRSYPNDPTRSTPTFIHEAFHVQQYHDLGSMGKRGWGFFRPFLTRYFSWFIQEFFYNIFIKKTKLSKANRYAYRYHPMEIPAYDYEAEFYQGCYTYLQYGMDNFLREHFHLIQIKPLTIPKPKWWASVLGTSFNFIIALFQPILLGIIWSFTRMLGAKKNPR